MSSRELRAFLGLGAARDSSGYSTTAPVAADRQLRELQKAPDTETA
jgi:hypothetical protein